MKKEFKKIILLVLFILVTFFSFFDNAEAFSSSIYYPFGSSKLTYKTKGVVDGNGNLINRGFKSFSTFKLMNDKSAVNVAFCLEPGTTFVENDLNVLTYNQYRSHREKYHYYTKGVTLSSTQQMLLQKISTVANINLNSNEATIIAAQALYWEIIKTERTGFSSCASENCFPDSKNTVSFYPVLKKNKSSVKTLKGTTASQIINEYDRLVNTTYNTFEKNPGGVFKIESEARTSAPTVLKYDGLGNWTATIYDGAANFKNWIAESYSKESGISVQISQDGTSVTITSTKKITDKQLIEIKTKGTPQQISVYVGQKNPSVQALFNPGTTVISKYLYVKTEDTKYGLRINKIDKETGAKLSGAKFELCSDKYCNNVIGSDVTASLFFYFPATFLVDDVGTYYYREVEPPSGYDPDEQIHEVELTHEHVYDGYGSGNPLIIDVPNEKHVEPEAPIINYQLKIKKVDSESKQPLKGVKFRICSDDDCRNVITNKSTDVNGVITYDGLLSIGTYYVQETKALDGYISNNTPTPILVTSDNVAGSNSYAEKVIENSRKKYSFNLTKNTVDENGKITKLDDGCNSGNKSATFTVKSSNGKKLLFEKTEEGKYKLSTTGSEEIKTCNGAFSVDGLTDCKYTIEETKAPEGLSLPNPSTKEVDVCGSDKNISFTNGFVGLEFQKKNENGEFISGGKFVLEQKINGTWANVKIQEKSKGVYAYTTSGDNYLFETYDGEEYKGIAYISGLPAGEYRVVEKQAPEGYELIEVAEVPKIKISDTYKDGYYILTLVNHAINKTGSNAVAELIVTISTGRKVLNYVLIVSSLAALLAIAIIIRKKIKK